MLSEEFLAELHSRFPTWLQELRREMVQIELAEAWDRERKRSWRRTLKLAKARASRRELAMAQRAESQTKLSEEKMRMAIETEKKKEEALNHGVTVKESGPPDIVRDIMWVYYNLGDLIVTDEALGVRVLDAKVLSGAPSNGAITFAEYALRKPDHFVERFVIKLLPKTVTLDSDEEIDEEAQLAELDPSFQDMKDFFRLKVTE